MRRKIGAGRLAVRVVNGRLALIATIDGAPRRVVSIDTLGNRIAGIYVVANPDKLRPLARALTLMSA